MLLTEARRRLGRDGDVGSGEVGRADAIEPALVIVVEVLHLAAGVARRGLASATAAAPPAPARLGSFTTGTVLYTV